MDDPALGPPEKMAERSEDLTPMMSQYHDLCERYDDSLVLFQVGDFYETFCEAAETVSRLLEITLTKREDSTGTYPMAGIPMDNAESYVETLLDAGYRVAVADQVQEPEEASGVVDRAVTRIVTPGTLTEDELLETDDNNFVACLTESTGDADESDSPGADAEYGLALLDVSTGDFYVTGTDSLSTVADEVGRFAPPEAIVGPGVRVGAEEAFDADCMVTPYDEAAFESDRARETVAAYFGSPDRLLASDAEIRACGALLAYAEYTRGGQDGYLDYLNHLTRYDPREYMLMDAVALRSLELFERRGVHGAGGATLVEVVDETASAIGSRKLKDWLRRPLVDRERIEARHAAVEEWTERVRTREAVHDRLRDVYDVERLIARVSRGRANARDLRSLKETLDVVPDLKAHLADAETEKLREIRESLDDLEDVRDLIGEAIRENPPAEITEGDLIREGYDEELDDLRETERSGKAWIDDLQAQERERTGIDSLKVGHNSVHGYYIEVTDANLDRVPDDYTRRQTLKNSERYYTPELKEREDEIISAEQRADDLEYELFREVRSRVGAESERIQRLADTVAELDALVSLAEVAAKHDYARPEMVEDGVRIEGGRHPVVERTQESFVPNDAAFDDDSFVAVITGPNMSGKSTYMRQVALICVLAQVGSFVPADAAELRIVDRVFTRVGASDDIAGGQSTFMVEMTELSEILRAATEDSLVLLDEVGRGTSTTDGFAIARAVTEYVHDRVGATTLFATHHHDLTAVADDLPGAFNRHFAADREAEDGDVTFSHEIRPGPATASYGVEVASMAGVPDPVVDRARALLDGHEGADEEAAAGGGAAEASPAARARTEADDSPAVAADGDPDVPLSVAERLRSTSIADTTPLEALELLDELKRELD
ncbi:DNA mismatch repair protein MutS [Halostella sp. JP-L12]|uniref:DNA mismatch repair protein MutS n=1 Tax=Halostella TaxID=1843185 RepID=UPI000EF80044|nr:MULTISPECIES: DNA mismatch repair protein MutS [Halostella]NHN47885.1 DNA mismatch repair protein MutS [Halostella sp. JP-L12]